MMANYFILVFTIVFWRIYGTNICDSNRFPLINSDDANLFDSDSSIETKIIDYIILPSGDLLASRTTLNSEWNED